MYAANTAVPVERSKAEIERMLSRHKCTQFLIGTDHEKRTARVQFKARERIVRFELALEDIGRRRTRLDQIERQRWRALVLVIKAKLESVESGISTFEDEFMAQIVMPGDRTVSELVTPLIVSAYKTGHLPNGLAALPAKGQSGQ